MRVRVASVQFPLRSYDSFDQFALAVRTHLTVAQDYGARIVVFPEYLTGGLLTVPGTPRDLRGWDRWTEPYRDLFRSLAAETGMIICGGTHLLRDGEHRYNTAHLFTPDGQVHLQHKLHLTPFEKDPWALTPGQTLTIFTTPVGRLAILVCYDIEFPEAVRAVVEAGAEILLCPAATDDRPGYWRVRYCAHARTVENQVYVALAPLVGAVAGVRGLEQGYGHAAVLSPCDIPFAPTGVLAEADVGHAMVAVGEVDLSLLAQVRAAGSVTPLQDRKPRYPVRSADLTLRAAGD